MTQPTINDAFNQAIRHHQRGELAAAESLYRSILRTEPHHPEATQLLGVIAYQTGRHADAIELISRAIALKPNVADFHHNLANAYEALGRLDEALSAYTRATELKPNLADAHNGRATILFMKDQLDAAAEGFATTLALRPDHVVAQNNLAEIRRVQQRWDEAESGFRRALELDPRLAAAHHGLGNCLQNQGKFADAEACYRRAIQLSPNTADAWANLGKLLSRSDKTLDESIDALRRAVAINPKLHESWHALAHALRQRGLPEESAEAFKHVVELIPHAAGAWSDLAVINYMIPGRLDQAVHACERALAIDPNLAEAHNNMGNALLAQRRVAEALDHWRRAIELRPQGGSAHSNLLLGMHYLPDVSPAQIKAETLAWAARRATPLYPRNPRFANDRNAERPLRIGYVSQDFRHHPVATFLEPIVASHERQAFEVTCYACVDAPDARTEVFKRLADRWRDIQPISDEDAAAMIRADGIDILVDLSGHIAENRLLVFARKPAPVQVTYLGYPDTTGLATMDYRLTDALHDPPGVGDDHHVEKLIRLPNTAWCYQPWTPDQVSPLPAGAKGFVTFGSLNNLVKITDAAIECWSRILSATPGSKLMLMVHSEGLTTDRLRQRFAAHSISSDRLIILPRVTHDEYIRLFAQIDICLDPFPYNGHTTTCNSLWMGVPVVTIAGGTHVSRAGVSVLTNVGVPQFIARTIDEYVELATRWASDLGALAGLRRKLRPMMQASPLMDAKTFTRNLEAAYRDMWRQYCVAPPLGGD